MYTLIYHGDEMVINYFSSLTKAIEYAISEIKDHNDGEFEEDKQIARRLGTNESLGTKLSQYTRMLFDRDQSLQAIIFDQLDDIGFCMYTIQWKSDSDIDPIYENKFS